MHIKEKRLKAIKSRKVFLRKKCAHCREKFKNQEMWVVKRFGKYGEVNKYYYCKECMPSKEDVLNEIDTDEILYGIAYVDDFFKFRKKDYSRVEAAKIQVSSAKK